MMEKHVRSLLPIGSVVLLNGGKKPLMIYGIRQADAQDTSKEYDYISVLYPEGNLGEKTQFLFNHSDIEKILFRGFEDELRAQFMEALVGYYKSEGQLDG